MIAGAAFAAASCDLGQFPESPTDTRLAETELAARKVLTVADGYVHGQVYGDTYKTTVTLLSQGMKIAYTGTEAAYAGSGYVLEIEFNSSIEGLPAGTYAADKLDEAATALKGKNVWMHSAGTYNPDNTSLKYISGDESEVIIENASFTVAKEGEKYTISADILSNTGVRTNIEFSGAIEFRDVLAYLEPSKASGITINCTDVTVEPSKDNADNFGYYAVYKGYGLAPLDFDVILTGKNGETVTLSIECWKYYDDPITVDSFENVPDAAVYTLDPMSDWYLMSGNWDILAQDSQTGEYYYNTALAYRDQEPTGSHTLVSDGVVYYLGYGANDSVQIDVDEKGNVISVDGALTSANGSTVNIKYVPKN